ncbi:hypothetical protein KP79_PYT25200 [Mizuhopecten yessoensis]|uniref:C3H1-type domain-containing protein n=1 Tax=Mizuhopecten yessoensis TaxID=6573 RepID=A0A210PRT7_MIZYE|nr:hypothetical protein KP79_PYT25200 [Mizuhopecten yessoensis]
MPPGRRKRAAAARHTLIPKRETEEVGVQPGPTAVQLPGTNAVPPISAIVADLLVQMRAEGLVLRQPAQLPVPSGAFTQPTAAAGSAEQTDADMFQRGNQEEQPMFLAQANNASLLQSSAPTVSAQYEVTPQLPVAGQGPSHLSAAARPDSASASFLVEQAMNNITGTPAHDISTPIMSSVSRPLDMHVDTRTKQKIWADQYVDFGSLLSTNGSEQFNITVTDNTLALIPKTKPVAIKSMDHWISAFQVFVTVVVQAKPELAGPLMKYANIIQHISRKAGDLAANHYDVNFRKCRQAAPHQLPFDQVNQELFLEAMTYNLARKGQPSQNEHEQGHAQGKSTQGKVCFAFQRKGVCNRQHCVFKHLCKTCGGPHSFRKCSKTDNYAQVPSSGSSKPSSAPKPKSN